MSGQDSDISELIHLWVKCKTALIGSCDAPCIALPRLLDGTHTDGIVACAEHRHGDRLRQFREAVPVSTAPPARITVRHSAISFG